MTIKSEKAEFTNKFYKLFLFFSLLVLTVLNCYFSFITGNPKRLIPLFFDIIIFLLLINRHKSLKPSVITWASLCLLIFPLFFVIVEEMVHIEDAVQATSFAPQYSIRYAKALLGFTILIGVGSIKIKQEEVTIS